MDEMRGLEFKIVGNTVSSTRSVDKLRSSLKETAKQANLFKRAISGLSTGGLKLLKSAVSKATSPIANFAKKLGAVGAAFKRILFYRVIRSVIREIGDAFKYGVNNLYAWSQLFDGRFASSMDRITTAFNYFKNSIGAAVAPIINALAPAIDYLVDKIVVLLNAINQLFAKLTGASYWTKANKVAAQYADNATAAGKAAKEALRYLAPFDELNVLPSNKDSGSGSGGGNAVDSGLFETREAFSEAISDFADKIKAAWNSGDWEEVGRFLGGKVNELIEKIPWADLGTKVGKFINALWGTQYWSLDEINFTNLGNRIAEFFNNAIENIDWDIAGRLPVKKLTSIIDTIIGFLGGLKWGTIATSISSYFKGALNELTDWFNGVNWSKMGSNLYQNIKTFVQNIDWGGLASSAFELLGTALRSAFQFLSGFFGDIWSDIKTWWTTEIQGVTFVETVSNLWTALKTALGDINAWVETNILKPFFDGLLGGDGKWEELKANFTNKLISIYNGIVEWVQEHAPKLADWLNLEKVDPIEIPVTADIVDSTQSVSVTVGATANINDSKNKIPKANREVGGFTALLTTATKSDAWTTPAVYANTLMTNPDFAPDWKTPSVFTTATLRYYGFASDWTYPSAYTTATLKDYGFASDWSRPSAWTTATMKDYGFASGWTRPSIYATAQFTSVNITAVKGVQIPVTGKVTAVTKAAGGVYSGGAWHPISAYASGGSPFGGQMFIAREAGPELVGTLKGHTAVMNNDQIVASVSAGVARAISNIEFHMNGFATPSYSVQSGGIDYEDIVNAIVDGISRADISNDTYLDGQKIYDSTVEYNRRNTRRTGVNAFA